MMGENSEMMLDGTCCSSCGEFLGSSANGYPTQCGNCARASTTATRVQTAAHPDRTHPCPLCTRKMKSETGVAQHIRDFHGVTPEVVDGPAPLIAILERLIPLLDHEIQSRDGADLKVFLGLGVHAQVVIAKLKERSNARI